MREALSRSQKRTSRGLFPELKRRNRARNQPSLIGPQKIGDAAWNTARMLSMVFEVIQPDLEIDRRHVATFALPRQSAVCGALRAVLWRDSGKFWQRAAVGQNFMLKPVLSDRPAAGSGRNVEPAYPGG